MALILDLAKEKGIPVERVARDVLDRTSGTGVHQGVIALVRSDLGNRTLSSLLDDLEDKAEQPFLLVLCKVLLEQNLGADALAQFHADTEAHMADFNRTARQLYDNFMATTGLK